MTKQTTNTLLIVGGVLVVYFIYTRSKSGRPGQATPNSTSGLGTPSNNNSSFFSTIGGAANNVGTLYNDITNSSLIKGIFGGSNAPNPATNSPSQTGNPNNASSTLSDLYDSFLNNSPDGSDGNFTVPADSGTSGSNLNIPATNATA